MIATKDKPQLPLNLREAAGRVSAKDNPDSPLWKEKKLDTDAIRKSGQQMILTDRLDVHGREDEKGRVYVGPQQVGKKDWTFPEKGQPGQAQPQPPSGEEMSKRLFGKTGVGDEEFDPTARDADNMLQDYLKSYYPEPTTPISEETEKRSAPILRQEFKKLFPTIRYDDRRSLSADDKKIWEPVRSGIKKIVEDKVKFKRGQNQANRLKVLDAFNKTKLEYKAQRGAKNLIGKINETVRLVEDLEGDKQKGAVDAVRLTEAQFKSVKGVFGDMFEESTITETAVDKETGRKVVQKAKMYELSPAYPLTEVRKVAQEAMAGLRKTHNITGPTIQGVSTRSIEGTGYGGMEITGAGQGQPEETPTGEELTARFTKKGLTTKEQQLAEAKTWTEKERTTLREYLKMLEERSVASSQGT